jgi:hypothetical protein
MGLVVQAKENYRQGRNGKVWDTVLSNYGNREIELAECVGRLL